MLYFMQILRLSYKLNGLSELPFTPEDDSKMQDLLEHAVLAVECENSLWRAKQMPNYNTPLTPQKRLDGRLGLKKGAVLPTIIIKEEDRSPLRTWQRDRKIPIHIWHAFFDEAYGISLADAEKLILRGDIEPTKQVFQAPGGATTEKVIYKIYYRQLIPWLPQLRNHNLLQTRSRIRTAIFFPTCASSAENRNYQQKRCQSWTR